MVLNIHIRKQCHSLCPPPSYFGINKVSTKLDHLPLFLAQNQTTSFLQLLIKIPFLSSSPMWRTSCHDHTFGGLWKWAITRLAFYIHHFYSSVTIDTKHCHQHKSNLLSTQQQDTAERTKYKALRNLVLNLPQSGKKNIHKYLQILSQLLVFCL